MKTRSLPYFVHESDPPAKQAIQLCAMELFATRGVDGVTVRDIAARTGYSNPALFRHFATKEDLARSLFDTCYRRLAAMVLKPGSGLREVVVDALGLIESSPDSVLFVLENLRRFWREMPEPTRAVALPGAMRRLVEAEQAKGTVRADLDPQLAATLILGLLTQMARMAHFSELPRPPGEMADAVFDLLDRGLKG